MGKSSKRKTVKKKTGLPSWIWLAVLAVLLFGGGAIYSLANGAGNPNAVASLPATVSVAEAAQMRDEGAFILDVREPDEWNEAHIPGATLIPLGDLPNRLQEVPQDQEVVVVCRSGNRSATGRNILKNAGYTQVTSMDGGVAQWRSMGLPTTTGP
jgi:rhodanese-related sulfurtransferase